MTNTKNTKNNKNNIINKPDQYYHQELSHRLFESLDLSSKGFIYKKDLIGTLESVGLLKDDPRLKSLRSALKSYTDSQEINFTDFKKLFKLNQDLIEKALKKDLMIPDFKCFCEEIENIYKDLLLLKDGKVADYIPQLQKVDPDLFAISICTVDGQQYHIGDYEKTFSAQSTCKPINYCMALKENGENKVHQYIGREPSGHGFNELTLNADHRPHNPMINAGAIISCALIGAENSNASRFESVLDCWRDLTAGSKIGFDNSVYLSERETSDRNYALGYFMKEQGAFPKNAELKDVLSFYFQCCSVELDVCSQAKAAATLANSGTSPWSQKQVFSADIVKNCLSLMFSCGMYDYSGEFAFSVGLPAKSGVSGSLMLVVPNVMGISIYSPRLDKLGNSVRGVAFCKRLVAEYNFHNFDNVLSSGEKKDPRKPKYIDVIDQVTELCTAAGDGNLEEIKVLNVNHIPLDGRDKQGRGALHMAVAEENINIVQYLIEHGVNLSAKDMSGSTPLSEAKRIGNKELIEMLEKYGAK